MTDEVDVLRISGITIFVTYAARVRTRRRLHGSPVADGTGGTVMKEDPGPVGLLGGLA